MALRFRTTGMKKSTRNRIILLIIVFFASIALFYVLLNHHTEPVTPQVSGPTLPTVSVRSFGADQQKLAGYTQDMNVTEMTDSLVPISDDRQLSFTVDTYGQQISSASYQIHSVDTARMISSDKISSLKKKDQTVTFSTQFTNLLNKGTKYVLTLLLKSNGRTVRYYSLITIADNEHLSDLLQFASEFHRKSLSKDDYSDLAKYLETDDTVAQGDFSYVNIHSTINDIGMESFSHKVTSTPVLSVTDITDDTASMKLTYTLRHKKKNYLCTESYRVRYGEPRMFLLDFERAIDIIPDSDSFSVQNNSLVIGASHTNPVIMSNEAESVVAFVQTGSLYEYNVNQNTLKTVFSFGDSSDARLLNQDHAIRILNIDASGSMDFVVYGYMNSFSHEGESGIDLYHYDSSSDAVTEEGFISSENPLSYLKENFSELLYRTSGGRFYCLMDHNLLGIDLATDQTETLLSDLKDGQYCVSSDMRYIAWTASDKPSSVINVRDLSSDKTWHIKPKKKTDRLRALSFLDEDLVYGAVSASETDTGYMHSLYIVSFQNEKLNTLKTYHKKGIVVSKIKVSDNALILTRLRKSKDSYRSTSSDTILNTLSSGDSGIQLETIPDDDTGFVQCITISQMPASSAGSLRVS